MSNIKRAAFDETRQPREETHDVLSCRFCGKETARQTLSDFGARCYACFSEYCRAPQSRPHVPDSAVPAGASYAWAHRLRYRHQTGERLTKAQIDAYRWVLDGSPFTDAREVREIPAGMDTDPRFGAWVAGSAA